MFRRISQFFFICALALGCSACGFHLRGTTPLPPAMHTLYLESNSPYSAFMRELRSTFKFSGIHLTDDAKSAPLTLAILSENLNTQQTSVGSSQQMQDYIATYTVIYAIKDHSGKTLVGPTTLSDQQLITTVANEILTNSNKLDAAKKTMYDNIIHQLTMQLSSPVTQKQLLKKPVHKKNVRPVANS